MCKIFWYTKLLCPQKNVPYQDAVVSHPIGTVRLGIGFGVSFRDRFQRRVWKREGSDEGLGGRFREGLREVWSRFWSNCGEGFQQGSREKIQQGFGGGCRFWKVLDKAPLDRSATSADRTPSSGRCSTLAKASRCQPKRKMLMPLMKLISQCLNF